MSALDSSFFFNSFQHGRPPQSLPGEWVDLAKDPSAAHRLLRLGVSPRKDLPVLMLQDSASKLRLLALRTAPEEALRLANGESVGSSSVRVYSSNWCTDCRRAREILEDRGKPYELVNVDQDHEAETAVVARSGGRRVVPTLLFDDRFWAFHPNENLLELLLDGVEPPKAA